MELSREFQVPVPIEEAWAALSDLERLVPCVPGLELDEVDGEEYRGALRIRVGSSTAQYKGTGRFVERDEGARRSVVVLEGSETSGHGEARVSVTTTMSPAEGGTQVYVGASVALGGEAASAGEELLADVGTRLVQHFVDCVRADVLGRSESAPPEGGWFQVEATTEPLAERAAHAWASKGGRDAGGARGGGETAPPLPPSPPRVGVGADVGVASPGAEARNAARVPAAGEGLPRPRSSKAPRARRTKGLGFEAIKPGREWDVVARQALTVVALLGGAVWGLVRGWLRARRS